VAIGHDESTINNAPIVLALLLLLLLLYSTVVTVIGETSGKPIIRPIFFVKIHGK